MAPEGLTSAATIALGSSVLFVENVGQLGEGARFRVYGSPPLWLADDGLWVTAVARPADLSTDGDGGGKGRRHDEQSGNAASFSPVPLSAQSPVVPGVALKFTFPESNPHPVLEPFNRLETRVSFFRGSESTGWRPDVPVWGGVRYRNLYPGLDLELLGEGRTWTWRLVTGQPELAAIGLEALVEDVRLQVDGADEVQVDGGILRLSTRVGEVRLPLLAIAANPSGPLQGHAEPTTSGNLVNHPFAPGGGSGELVTFSTGQTDLIYSTFLGGTGVDGSGYGYDVRLAVDAAGAVYVVGSTSSGDFPTMPGAFDRGYNDSGNDLFVAKLNASGTALVYSTFLGGTGSYSARGVAVDGDGAAYVAGWTGSPDFPTTPGALKTSFRYDACTPGFYDPCVDAFVVKLNATGTGLIYGTFLGGAHQDSAGDIAVDGSGAAYVAGYTWSNDFPTTSGAFDTSFDPATCTTFGGSPQWPCGDAFVAKLNASGSGLIYSTFLGGPGTDAASAIAVDASGAAYVIGSPSYYFPTTPGAFDTSHADGLCGHGSNSYVCRDAFVAKLGADGTTLVYSTFLGGWSDDYARAIAVDGNGAAYVAGSTSSVDFPTTAGAFDTSHRARPQPSCSDNVCLPEGFVVKLSADGTTLAYSTFLGSIGPADALAVDGAGYAFVADGSGGTAPLGALNPTGSCLISRTFPADGVSVDVRDLAVDASGAVYLTGVTSSSDFPTTPGAYDRGYNGGGDVFVAKLGWRGASQPPVSTPVAAPYRLYLPLALGRTCGP